MFKLTEFSSEVIKNILQIPKGRVATYGQIAKLSGKEHAARAVSWILHSCSRKYKLPWHRVLNSQGKISFDKMATNYLLQKRRLQSEGLAFLNEDQILLSKYQWKKGIEPANKGRLKKNKS
jgi:methylated-DNA-protein-cysteine methyltransferase-like protein